MMNKKTMKAAGLAAVLLGLAVLPAAAKDSRGNGRGNNNAPRMECDMQAPMPMRNGGMQEPDLIGTVSKVDEANQLVTVRDVDGTDHVIHVSDFTRIMVIDPAAERPARNRNNDDNDRPAFQTIKDIKKDSSVAVNYFNVETKTTEAQRIFIIVK